MPKECHGAIPGKFGVFAVIAPATWIGEGMVGFVPIEFIKRLARNPQRTFEPLDHFLVDAFIKGAEMPHQGCSQGRDLLRGLFDIAVIDRCGIDIGCKRSIQRPSATKAPTDRSDFAR